MIQPNSGALSGNHAYFWLTMVFIDPGSAVQNFHYLPGPSVVLGPSSGMTGFGTWIPGSFIDAILRFVLFDVYELDRMISLIKLICVSQLVLLKI